MARSIDLADLLGVRLGQRSTEDREVLAEDEHQAPVDGAVASDDAIAQVALLVQTEVGGPMDNERVELDERSRIQQQVQSLARGQLALGMLLVDAFLTATESRLGARSARRWLDLVPVVGHSYVVLLATLTSDRRNRTVPSRRGPRSSIHRTGGLVARSVENSDGCG